MLWEDLTFPDDTFDLILCLDQASPVTDPNLLREVSRVLRPQGEYVCAVEKTTVQGLEAILPRYGYNEVAYQVDLQPPHKNQAPQISEISRYFERICTLRQRPKTSFMFLADPTKEGGEGEERQGMQDAPADPKLPSEGSAQVDHAFDLDESHVAGVELWFCGTQNLPAPRSKEVNLPYYKLSERIQSMFHTMQVERHGAQRLDAGGVETPFFDASPLQEPTDPYTAPPRPGSPQQDWETTGVHVRPLNSGKRPEKPQLQLDQLDAHLQELDAMGRRFKADFERLLFEARESLDERDGSLLQAIEALGHRSTIEALRHRIEELEAQVSPNAPEDGADRDEVPESSETIQIGLGKEGGKDENE